MTTPPNGLRAQVKAFHAAIKSNDVALLERQKQQGFPLDWAQAFSETSLPETAIRYGSVEAAWWLMAQGIMPEHWGVFTGKVWTSFLKKGFAMAVTGTGPRIPMDVYKDILKVAVKTTGEKLPGWLDSLWSTSATTVQSLWGQVNRSLDTWLAESLDEKPSPDKSNEPSTVAPKPPREASKPRVRTRKSAAPEAPRPSTPKPARRR